MDSIVKPLLTQVTAISVLYATVVQQLSVGDPAAKVGIREVAKATRQLFANFKEKQALMKSSISMSPGFAPNKGVVIKMIKFFVSEVTAAIKLFKELMKLVANILKLTPLIALVMSQLAQAREYLSKRKVWLAKTIDRLKQKLEKNLEWLKRKAAIAIGEVFTKARKKYYETLLKKLQEPSKSDAKDKIQNIKNLRKYYETQIKEKEQELKDFEQQKADIEKDKTYWNSRWETEAKNDSTILLDDAPGVGKNFNG